MGLKAILNQANHRGEPKISRSRTGFRRRAILVICAVSVVATLAVFSSHTADASVRQGSWWRTEWYMNKAETQAWADNPTGMIMRNSGFGAILVPWWARAGIMAYSYSFKAIAWDALRNGRCLKISWIHSNLPVPESYYGWACG